MENRALQTADRDGKEQNRLPAANRTLPGNEMPRAGDHVIEEAQQHVPLYQDGKSKLDSSVRNYVDVTKHDGKRGKGTYIEMMNIANQKEPPRQGVTNAGHADFDNISLDIKDSSQHPENEEDDDVSEDEEPEEQYTPIGFFQLFRHADGKDRLLMLVGTLAAMGNGCAFPLNLLIYGKVLNIFIANDIGKHVNTTGVYPMALAEPEVTLDVWPQVSRLIIYFCFIGGCVFVLGYMEIAFWSWAAERQTQRIRTLFFKSILKQHIGWFDTHHSGELNSRLSDDILRINSGVGDKLATLIQWMTTFLAGYILGFVTNWKLTLVILSMAPVLVIAIAMMAKTVQRFARLEQAAYARAGGVAEEALGAIRTVAAFGGELKEAARYNKNLLGARKVGVMRGVATGIGTGMFWIVIFGSFGLAFWYGSKLVNEESVRGGDVLQVFMGVMIGTLSLGHAAPNLEYIAGARGAAAAVYGIIDLVSEIDSSSEEGKIPQKLEGNIEFVDVNFSYPARQSLQVLTNFNLRVNVGQTVALVGASGSGKSTTIQLLQRFYDPDSGLVKLDGHDLRDVNVTWLRQNLGVVSQEPVLFATTICENIRYGRDDVTQEQMVQAAREANAYDFIMQLPEKFDTLVGERGAQLSGGQKQRIAIARALVRNPKVLLLDEATSALDNESEAAVQDALDKARRGRTTIVIAHRLSTIQTADLIVGINDGSVIEMGTHEDLMEQGGIYYSLVRGQTARDLASDSELSLYELDDSLGAIIPPPALLRGGSTRKAGQRARRDSVISNRGSFRRHDSVTSSGNRRSRRESVVSVISDDVWSEKDEEELVEKIPPAPVKRIIQLNAPEWPYILIGCLSAVFIGALYPSFAVLFSEILGNFAQTDTDKQATNAALFSGLIAALGFIVAIATVLQHYFFALSGENLTQRLRSMAFSAMLRQDISWFDERCNQLGALTTRLSTDSSLVRGAAGQQLGVIVQAVTNMGSAIIIAFVFGPKLALVVVAFLPLLVLAGVVQGKLFQRFSKEEKTTLEEGGKIAVEAIDNIRTVASLNRQPTFQEYFNHHFDKMYIKGVKKSQVYGIFYSVSQSIIFFAYAATFAYGSQLIDKGEMPFRHVFKVFAAITFGGQALGRTGSYAPDLSKAKTSAAKLFMLIDRKPSIDSSSPTGKTPESCEGNIEFKNVRFRYPSREDVEVLQGLSFKVKQGQTLALVGSSGCGKSTTVQLMERFYDTVKGHVIMDGQSVKGLNIQWLRSHLGVVSQEPVLFDASVAYNIAYGDNSRVVGLQEVMEAAKKANIDTFIRSLPMGYDTNVGDRGSQLSGGQKQRIAIARALLRNPRVLLLDEATSALDTESEQIVQEALDTARHGRTCITIAHRLSTIQNADIIAVIHNGQVVEYGRHQQLMHKQGHYYRLQQVQNRYRQAN